MEEKRRHPRYEFDGPVLLVVEQTDEGPILVLTSYRDVSLGGASIVAPEPLAEQKVAIKPGANVRLLADQQEAGRRAIVVQLGDDRLHLRLNSGEELTDFELRRLLEAIEAEKQGTEA